VLDHFQESEVRSQKTEDRAAGVFRAAHRAPMNHNCHDMAKTFPALDAPPKTPPYLTSVI
jgi:hypothetical protein